jgi:hypothetical protein
MRPRFVMPARINISRPVDALGIGARHDKALPFHGKLRANMAGVD